MMSYMDFHHAIRLCVDYVHKVKEALQLEDVFELYCFTACHSDLEQLASTLLDILVKNFTDFAETECFLDHASKDFLEVCLSSQEIENDNLEEEEVSVLHCNIYTFTFQAQVPGALNCFFLGKDVLHKAQKRGSKKHFLCVKVRSKELKFLRVFACNSGTQMRVRDSSATRIFFKKKR